MKVRPSVKPMCDKCKVIKRKGRHMESRHVVCLFFVLFEGPQMQRLSASFALYPFGAVTPVCGKIIPNGYNMIL